MTLPEHLSYSQVDSLLTCGEKYRLTRVLHAPENPAVWLVGGSSVHEVTEWCDKQIHKGDWPNPSEVARVWRETFDRLTAELLEVEPDTSKWSVGGRKSKAFPNGEDLHWWRPAGLVMVDAYMKWRDNNRHLQILQIGDDAAIELEMIVSIGGRGFRLAIDRVFVDSRTGVVLIVDLKTGASAVPQTLQLGFYREAVRQAYGVTPDYGSYYMARKAELDGPHDLTHWTPELLDDIVAKAAKIRDLGLFIPHPGRLCGTCGVAKYCRAVGGSDEPLFLTRKDEE